MGIGSKLYRGSVLIGLAVPEAFANWQAPTTAELNASNGLIWNLSCALDEGGTKFDLGDSDTDDSLTFCQAAGSTNPTFFNPDVTFQINRSTNATANDQANTAFNLIAFPDTEYFAYLRIGKSADVPFAIGDQVSLVRVSSDYPVDNVGSGDNVTTTQNWLVAGDVQWNYTLVS